MANANLLWFCFLALFFGMEVNKICAAHETSYTVIPKAVPVENTLIGDTFIRSKIECGAECRKRSPCVGAIFRRGIHPSCALLSSYSNNTKGSSDEDFMKMDPGLSYRDYGPLMLLNDEPGNNENIFLDVPIGTSGTIVAVKFYAKKAGIFYLEGWRALQFNSTLLDLVWQLQVTSASPGQNLQTVTRTNVMAGDFLGIAYTGDYLSGVVYYEQEGQSPVNVDTNDPRMQKVYSHSRYVGDPAISIDSTAWPSFARKAMAMELIIL